MLSARGRTRASRRPAKPLCHRAPGPRNPRRPVKPRSGAFAPAVTLPRARQTFVNRSYAARPSNVPAGKQPIGAAEQAINSRKSAAGKTTLARTDIRALDYLLEPLMKSFDRAFRES